MRTEQIDRQRSNKRIVATARRSQRCGSALLLVLVVVAALTLATFTFARVMLIERKASLVQGRSLQTRALAQSGMETVKRMLAEDEQVRLESGGLYDNPARLRGVLVLDDGTLTGRGRFTVVAPFIDDENNSGVRYGLEDESARLNLNTILLVDEYEEDGSRELLMQLPGMTEEIADAILDWIDEDDEPRQYGAELEYYSGLNPPYAPANGPLETIEQLLLVRGVVPELLFGPDINRNGLLDLSEQAGADTFAGIDNSTGELNRGWSGLMTLASAEANRQPDGTPRIDVNQEDLEELYEQLRNALDEDIATFIVAYRQFGPFKGQGRGESMSGSRLDFDQPGEVTLSTVLDLIGVKVRARPTSGDGRPIVLKTPFPDEPGQMQAYLPKLLDHVSVNPNPTIPGRININQAPRTILLGIPGIGEENVEEILNARVADPDSAQTDRAHETWLLTERIVTLDEMKALMPLITGGGDVYRAQIVGYYDGSGPLARFEACFDATGATPRLLSWREMTHLGQGYSSVVLGSLTPDQPTTDQ